MFFLKLDFVNTVACAATYRQRQRAQAIPIVTDFANPRNKLIFIVQ